MSNQATSLSRQTTAQDEQQLEKPSARSSNAGPAKAAILAEHYGPDPEPPAQHVQALRWLKLHLKAGFKPGNREYNQHSGF